MKKNLILTTLLAGCLLLSMIVTTEATTYGVNVTQYHYSPTSGSIKLAGHTYSGVYMRYGLNMTFTETTPWYWPNGYYQAFCVDDNDAGSFNNGFLTELDVNSPTRMKMASWLIHKYAHLATDNNGWAALQLAVWEAAFDWTDLSLTNTASNTYYLGTQAWSYTARNYVSALTSSGITWSTYTPKLTGFVHDKAYASEPLGKQNFLVRPIPEHFYSQVVACSASASLLASVVEKSRQRKST